MSDPVVESGHMSGQASSQQVYVFPASFSQQRLWFLDQLNPGSPVYNMPFAVRMRGTLNTDALRQAIEAVIDRHEILRTTLEIEDGQLIQVVHPAKRFDLPQIDLQRVPADTREQQLQQQVQSLSETPFDLQKGPLLRPTLLQMADTEHVLHLNMHHIIGDGWSQPILFGEIIALYEAFVAGRPSPLPEMELQYGDFAYWQQEWLESEEMQVQLNYWKQQLAGELPTLQLPIDYPRTSAQTPRGRRVNFRVAAPLVQDLQRLNKRHGKTMYMTLLALFQTLLHRYTGEQDVLVGTPIANRNAQEIENLIGFFVNTLVIRTDLSGNPTFTELLERVGRTTLDAYAHQDLPFEKLVEEVQPERSDLQNPLFQVLFVLQNTPLSELQVSGLTLTPIALEATTAKFDLLLETIEVGDELLVGFEYNTDLFAEATIERMGQHFQQLLQAVCENADRPLAELPMLTESELHQLVVEWNGLSSDTTSNAQQDTQPDILQPVHHLFETWAMKTPDALAVRDDMGNRLTYRELNEQANRLAHHLQKQGVQAESLVPICMHRSVHLVVAILGILKAGGAYVPLDPHFPAERIALILEDVQASLIVTERGLTDKLRAEGARLLCLDAQDVQATLAAESADNLPAVAGPEHLAYLIYTSGTTGRPKAVMVEHGSLLATLSSTQASYPLQAGETMAWIASVAFDIAVFELMSPLIVGGTSLVLSRDRVLDLPRLVDELAGVAAFQAVPVLMRQIVQTIRELGASERFDGLRYALTGGDSVPPELLAEMNVVFRHADIYVLYGPTEGTILASHLAVSRDKLLQKVLIGTRLPNTQLYVCDAMRNIVPIGVPGELYLGGRTVARGYRNRPDLTAEKFVDVSFAGRASERLYRTGDLVRYLPDGNLEFLGRVDNQVKIRGFRIELSEIESHLLARPDVQDCIVIVREDRPGDKQIVAYVVSTPTDAPEASLLRSALQEILPDYMVPSAFLLLEQFPLTPTGKVDRRALPRPEQAAYASEASYVAPTTETEQALAAIFTDLLGVGRAGVHDSFFHLGGHSLLATRAVSEIRTRLQKEISLRSFFETPTIAALAAQIDAHLTKEDSEQALAILPIPREGELPLSFAQERLWVLDQMMPNSSVYNMPFVVRLQGTLDQSALEGALNDVVARHESLRTTFADGQGGPVQVIAAPERFTLEAVPVSEQEAEARIQAEVEQPFDLQNGPLVRFTLLRVEENDHILLAVMHHIISDGWSMGVFTAEVGKLYVAHAKGTAPALAALPVQYADFAVWQRQWLQGEVLDAQMNYWQDKLGGELPVLEMATDRPRPPVQTYNGAAVSFELSPALTASLKAIGRERDATLFMTLLAAYQALLYRYTGQEDLCVGTPIAGRNRAETEGLIGFFVNTLVLRTSLAGKPTFAELLKRVRETSLGAFAHQDVPFEKVVEALQPERDASRSPLFQTMFALQNAPMDAVELPGVTLRPLAFDVHIAKFDLSLTLAEQAEGLHGHLEYNTDLFDRTTIERLTWHYQNLLQAIVEHVDQPITALPILSASERHQIVAEWNGDLPKAPEQPVHHLIEAWAAKTPDAVAVSDDQGGRLTYRELNEQANRLAHHLQQQGVQAETLVPICMQRSVRLVVGILAILKAGGAYVPLDPNFPQERIALILADTGAALIVTESELAEKVQAEGVTRLCLDTHEMQTKLLAQSAYNLPAVAGPEHLAYLIYTSGSTGRPKAVMVEHRNLTATLDAAQALFELQASDTMAWIASVAFDIAVYELMSPLLVGGTSRVLSRERVLDLPRLVDELAGVTAFHAVPVLMRQIVQAIRELGAVERFDHLRYVFIGGDSAPPELLFEMCAVFRRANVYVLYGPTEGTILCTKFAVLRDEPLQKVLIGTRLPNAHLYICDAEQNLVPIGVPGELYVGGTGVTRGYLHRDDLTAEKFVDVSLTGDGNAPERFYRTGDLVRYLPDGNLEFLGRIDNQVKVRGFRIELSEIEAVLLAQPGVQNCTVIVREDRPGDKRIVAYVVKAPHAQQDATELRTALQEKLPEYMVPSTFVEMEAFPLTTSGKVDRKALPQPLDMGLLRDATFLPPRNTLEMQLVRLWEETLGIKGIGVRDNFFQLGGYSLLAVQMMTSIRKQYGQNLSLAYLYQGGTIEQLAVLLSQDNPAVSSGSLVQLQEGPAEQAPLFLVHPAGGVVNGYMGLARSMPETNMYGLKSRGLEDEQEPLTSVEAMAETYLEAVRTVQPMGPYRLGGWSFGGVVAYEMAQQLQQQGQEVELLVMFDSRVPALGKLFSDRELMLQFVEDLAARFGSEVDPIALAEGTIDEGLQRLVEQARREGKMPPNFGLADIRRFFDVYRANNWANHHYKPTAYTGEVMLLIAEESAAAGLEHATFGWSDVAQHVDVHHVPGSHFSMLDVPHVATVVALLQERL